jgi:hypothetical protein
VIHGLEVRYFMPPGPEATVCWRKVLHAVEVIAKYDHRRLARMQRDLRGIAVGSSSGDAEYWRELRVCVVDEGYLARHDVTAFDVSGTIAHEAMHARLNRFGYLQPMRARVERLCCEAEVALGERLPPEEGRPVLERARALLAREPDSLWSDAALLEGDLAHLRQLGAPKWLLHWAARVRAAV